MSKIAMGTSREASPLAAHRYRAPQRTYSSRSTPSKAAAQHAAALEPLPASAGTRVVASELLKNNSLSPRITRTPRLTRDSDGKPLRRLDVGSKGRCLGIAHVTPPRRRDDNLPDVAANVNCAKVAAARSYRSHRPHPVAFRAGRFSSHAPGRRATPCQSPNRRAADRRSYRRASGPRRGAPRRSRATA
jgi:hypothetical protein